MNLKKNFKYYSFELRKHDKKGYLRNPLINIAYLTVLYVFLAVAVALMWLAKKSNRTYNEINIIIYYFIIPLSWIILLDMVLNIHWFKLSFILASFIALFLIKDFKIFSDNLFSKSRNFLMYFNKFWSNYVLSSVIICVILPIAIYAKLILMIFIKLR